MQTLRYRRSDSNCVCSCELAPTRELRDTLITDPRLHIRKLLPTAFQSLGDPCLPDLFTKDYPPLPGVIMMGSLFILFVIEMWLNAKTGGHSHGGPTGTSTGGDRHAANHSYGHGHGHAHAPGKSDNHTATPQYTVSSEKGVFNVADYRRRSVDDRSFDGKTLRSVYDDDEKATALSTMPAWFVAFYEQYVRQHTEIMDTIRPNRQIVSLIDEEKAQVSVMEYSTDEEEAAVDPAVLKKMSTNITLLEGGILFHSVFVGMTVSITIEGFVVFLVAICFHQMFEGLGLGSRIAAVPYPKSSLRPWFLVLAFGTTAPIGQAIGLLTRNTYDPDSAFGLIIVGVFNAMYVLGIVSCLRVKPLG